MTRAPNNESVVKIEDVPVTVSRAKRSEGDFRQYVQALANLKKGQSFLWKLSSNDRMAISIVQMLFNRRFVARKEDDTFRIGRIL